jgi:hypothetical protein
MKKQLLCVLKDTNPGKNFFLAENGTLASLEMSWEVVRRMTRYGGRNMNGSKACVVWGMCKEVKHLSCKTQMVFHCIVHQEAL